MIDIHELRRKLHSDDLIDHIGIHTNVKPVFVELLDRLEAVEKERDVLRDRLALESQENGALRDSVDRACEERDTLRALVVMRFDHDSPPQFTQGYELHDLTEPVTAEHCRWFVAEIARLRTDCDALRAKIEQMEKQEPVAHVWRCDNGHIHGSCEKTLLMGAALYALPGAKGE